VTWRSESVGTRASACDGSPDRKDAGDAFRARCPPGVGYPAGHMADDADVIVIGTGVGGMATASALAQIAGKRVLLLERHWVPGGFTHAFRRPGGLHWDVGVHYVGDSLGVGFFSRVFSFLSRGALRWNPLPDPFERFVYPDLEFAVPKGRDRYREALHAAFPAHRRAIDRFLKDRRRAAQGIGLVSMTGPRHPLARLFARSALQTTEAGLARRISDPRLRAVLASRWGDYGLPPGTSAFGVSAVIDEHYGDGAYYPVGGGPAIAQAFLEPVLAQGGRVLLGHEVTEILVRGNRAVGVRARGPRGEEQTLKAPFVVSGAGARTTYLRLLAAEHAGRLRAEIAAMPLVSAAVTLYLGLRESPRKLGLHGENVWIFTGHDHDALLANSASALAGAPGACYISFGSMNDPEAAANTAQIITLVPPGAFDAWRSKPWRRRGPEYERLKERIADGLLGLVEGYRPGFTDLVNYREASTPLSVERFTGHIGGQPYGLPGTPDRFRVPGLGVRTPVRGLFLTGADAGLIGLAGASMSGLNAAAAVLGRFGLFRVMRRVFTS